MPNSIDLKQSHEFRDARGTVVGYYIPAEEGVAGPDSPTAGPQRWERLYRQVMQERDRLQAEVEALREERNLYRKSLSALMREARVERVVCILGIKPLPGHPLSRER